MTSTSTQVATATIPAACSGGECSAEYDAEVPLLRRLAAGDASAFWALWLWHSDYLQRLCLQELDARQADAEDALARARQRAFSRLPRVALQMTNLKGWLVRVTTNVCHDIRREDRCRPWQSANLSNAGSEADEACAAPDCDPAEALLLRELEDFLRCAVHKLQPRLRAAAELYFLEEDTPAGVAEHLAISVANAHKRIQRARALLKAAVQVYLSAGFTSDDASRQHAERSRKLKIVCPRSSPRTVVQWKAHEHIRTSPGSQVG